MQPSRYLSFHYGFTIFLSAFLLFQVQPIVGKMILPWFGGSASVWTTCMLFFQALLLLGYLYCHGIVSYLSARAQSLVHILLLTASVFLLPLGLSESWRPDGSENPTVRILLLLVCSVGLPYFILATTGPLIQSWFARERPGVLPYRLFALSNLGSLLALLGYPVAVEPLIPTQGQAGLWSILFVCYAITCGLLAWRGRRLERLPHPVTDHHQPSIGARFIWIALASCPSILLLAITSHLTEDIAPVPLLWVLPLALYLLSFILCFDKRERYRREVFRPLSILGLIAIAAQPFFQNHVSIFISTLILLVSFFVVCMVCHGELADRQPAPNDLTGYYLMIAVGGVMGGFFVGVLAPYWFNSNYELSIGLAITAGIVWGIGQREERPASPIDRYLGWAVVSIFVIGISVIRMTYHWKDQQDTEFMGRNFYGRLKVFVGGEGDGRYRSLVHGHIIHGRQFTTASKQNQPTTYYGIDSGAGRALLAKSQKKPLRVGVIGLGAGTLLSYGRPGDYYRLYDINPLVMDVARTRFSYLSGSAAHAELVLGDARLVMERETPQHFDVLIVDAFSGDAVPVHLLTLEAIRLYLKHLNPDGVLAIHISNRYLDLKPVIKSAADSLKLQSGLIHANADQANGITPSDWILASADPEFFQKAKISEAITAINAQPDGHAWRDDYSSLLTVLKWPWPPRAAGR